MKDNFAQDRAHGEKGESFAREHISEIIVQPQQHFIFTDETAKASRENEKHSGGDILVGTRSEYKDRVFVNGPAVPIEVKSIFNGNAFFRTGDGQEDGSVYLTFELRSEKDDGTAKVGWLYEYLYFIDLHGHDKCWRAYDNEPPQLVYILNAYADEPVQLVYILYADKDGRSPMATIAFNTAKLFQRLEELLNNDRVTFLDTGDGRTWLNDPCRKWSQQDVKAGKILQSSDKKKRVTLWYLPLGELITAQPRIKLTNFREIKCPHIFDYYGTAFITAKDGNKFEIRSIVQNSGKDISKRYEQRNSIALKRLEHLARYADQERISVYE